MQHLELGLGAHWKGEVRTTSEAEAGRAEAGRLGMVSACV